jgi:hypothetical protein
MTTVRSGREIGAGMSGRPSIAPGRGEVSANSLSHTTVAASASMPRTNSPNFATHSQMRGIGLLWIRP